VQQVERQVSQAGGFAAADAVLGAGALAVAQLQPGHVGILLVGDEDLETVPVGVGERQLRAGVGILTAADRPGAGRPAGQVEARKLGDLGALARPAVGVDRRRPGVGGHGQHRGADALVGRQADREPHATRAKVVGEGVGGAGGVGPHHHRLLPGGRWELRQRQVGDLGVVGGGVGAGVARPQQASERLAGAVLAI
jgi:hypothetical protein